MMFFFFAFAFHPPLAALAHFNSWAPNLRISENQMSKELTGTSPTTAPALGALGNEETFTRISHT